MNKGASETTGFEEDRFPFVKMKRDLLRLYDGPEPPQEETTLEETAVEKMILETDPFIDLGSPLVEGRSGGAIHSNVFDWLNEGTYVPGAEDGGESLPESNWPSFPWPGIRIRMWSDGRVLILGQPTGWVFGQTRAECLQRAQMEKSPYRTAGLSKKKAREAEKRRIERQKSQPLPDLKSALPKKKGEKLQPLGYLQEIRGGGIYGKSIPGEYTGLELVFEGPGQRAVRVPKRKIDLALNGILRMDPAARREGRVEYRQKEAGAPVEVYVQENPLSEEVLSRMEKAIGAIPPSTFYGLALPVAPRERCKKRRRLWERIPDRGKEKEVGFGRGRGSVSAEDRSKDELDSGDPQIQMFEDIGEAKRPKGDG